ncbi:heavy metal translocating P-type ATPase [Schlesneria paludicola]|uniref:heavy metal translocating P-type ATPase n=1 Tax=Schlesneria paludicola TaxID=360056 RepID=UPI0012F7F5ED|nr:cation-translocating P-type ATPase [Schlesneria paludicola]
MARTRQTSEPEFCCFGCRFAASITSSAPGTESVFGPATALGLSVFFTMNVVMLTMALWSYTGQTQLPFELALRNFLRYGALAFSVPVLLLLGRPLISHAWAGLRNGRVSTDLLLSIGVLAAFALSALHTLRDEGHVYFEVGCVILVFVTLGRWMEAAGRAQASHALEHLERLVPDLVHRANAVGEIDVPRALMVVGEHFRVRAGERIPLDGRILRGRGVVDEQFFTGESCPIEKNCGDLLLGGTINLDGDLLVEVTAPPTGGALGKLINAVRMARISKGRYQQLSDTWSQWFFPIISVVAIAAFVFHGLRVDWDYGLLTALSVVLIACPCSLALATPLAIWAAMGTAAEKGILCRSGAALETLAGIRAIRWDKTGTLTTGTPQVLQIVGESSADRMNVIATARYMTASSNHLFSRAIRDELTDVVGVTSTVSDSTPVPADPESQWPVGNVRHDPHSMDLAGDVQTIPGRGLRLVTLHGDTVLLGSPSLMNDSGLSWGPHLSTVLHAPVYIDCPVVAIGFRGAVRGLFILEETIRPETIEAIEECRNRSLDQSILTGDRAARAMSFSKKLNLPVEAELLPEDKLAAVRSAHDQYDLVAMVGDGLNDAPALAAADVGIALGCGADVSRDSADICLLTTDLRLVPWIYDLSRRTVRTIRTNLAWSFAYNSVGVIVAASGQLHPALAAILMVASSLMVLGNSLRLSSKSSFFRHDSAQGMGGATSDVAPPDFRAYPKATP